MLAAITAITGYQGFQGYQGYQDYQGYQACCSARLDLAYCLSFGSLVWRNQAKSSLSSQALDSSLFVGKSAR
jgi:hypothetical protein